MSNTRVTLEPAFVLHSRPYSNTSLIVELFSKQYGRVPVLARSARGPKSRYRGKLQAFSPMLASWSGRGELCSLGQVELNGLPYILEGEALMCGFYLNELIMRLLHRDDSYPVVFEQYQITLNELVNAVNLEMSLRKFEKILLERLGYGLSLKQDAQNGLAIDSNKQYQFISERGFVHYQQFSEAVMVFSGKSLIAIGAEDFTDKTVLQDAKRLFRYVLTSHLGLKPLKSRDLLV